MYKLFLALLIVGNLGVFAKGIVSIKVYSVPFNNSYIIGINKNEIRKNYDIGINIKNSEIISSLNIEQTVNNLKLSDSLNANDFGDFRSFVKLKFAGGKIRKFYITSTGYIIEKNKVFDFNLEFLKLVYSFFPNNFRPYYQIWATSRSSSLHNLNSTKR
ncbi:MAG: hypothetical protein CFE21_05470 [Bacteroidetes bacterium B1(2017)]|nr:MAG: hypothetical protein CFE21_05470 [Bacteroidetes bacterium B1(2017)]